MSTVQEYLGVPAEWPVVENIKHAIVLMPSKMDIRKAKTGDPKACALHNAACRVFGVPNCAIGGRWAYIPQRDAKGKFYIARVQADHATQRAIRLFDKTGKMPEGGFKFIPVAPSHKYKYKNEYNKTYRRKLEEGVTTKRKYKKRYAKYRAIPRTFSE